MHIWRLIVCIAICGLTLPTMAQRALYKPQVHEISLVGGLAMYNNAYGDYTSGAPFSAIPQGGIQYTYHHSITDGFRFGVDYRALSTQRARDNDPSSFLPLDYNGTFVNMGYERKYHRGASQLYGGADVLIYFGQVEGDELLQRFNLEGAVSTTAWGGRAVAGYRLFFSPYVSVALEANVFYLAHNYSRAVIEENNGLRPVFPDNEIGAMAKVRLSYHFKKMKKRCTCKALNHR